MQLLVQLNSRCGHRHRLPRIAEMGSRTVARKNRGREYVWSRLSWMLIELFRDKGSNNVSNSNDLAGFEHTCSEELFALAK